MNEGGTPLIQSNDEKNFMFKYEGVNPTCSFKDRGSAVEISKAKEFGVKEVVCASTGNMGASVAAYCARAGIKATIYVPKFAPRPKVHQIKMMGARVMIVNGSYEDALNMTKKLNEKRGIYLVGDYPYREEGEKSVTFEILDQLNFIPPKYIVYPMGNAVLIAAAYKACMEFKEVGLIRKMPKLVGIQAEGCRPLVNAFKTGVLSQQINTHTIATAIDCGNPTNGLEALDGMEKTKGIAEFVTDREIISALKKLGKQGIYVEPAGAVSYAGAMKLGLEGKTVCVLTGHGLKDSRLF